MPGPCFGTVVFFNNDKGFGFIKPDETIDGVEKIFFHVSGMTVLEESCGGIDFDSASEDEPNEFHPIRRGVRLVFDWWSPRYANVRTYSGSSLGESRGPIAHEWNYEYLWKYAEEQIRRRPSPDQPLYKVVRLAQGLRTGGMLLPEKVLWIGFGKGALRQYFLDSDFEIVPDGIYVGSDRCFIDVSRYSVFGEWETASEGAGKDGFIKKLLLTM